MILGISGHRPSVLGCGYTIPNPIYDIIYKRMHDKFSELKPDKIISGFALGVDQWSVSLAIELGIPYIAAIPFEGQDSRWPYKSKMIYQNLLKTAEEVVIVGKLNKDKSNFSELMQLRNQWIIDNSTELLAVWNGDMHGGTFNAITYAKTKSNYQIHIVNPR